MTTTPDLTPNDLSHLSDEESLALSPQGEHAPGPEPLSSGAQAVLDAVLVPCTICQGIAAALRELADQVVPDEGNFLSPGTAAEIRAHILAIAGELRAQP